MPRARGFPSPLHAQSFAAQGVPHGLLCPLSAHILLIPANPRAGIAPEQPVGQAAYLTVLRGAGFDDRRAAEALRAVISYSTGYGLTELTCLGVPGIQKQSKLPSQRELLIRLGQALPPNTHAISQTRLSPILADRDPNACFESGLELILNGLRRLQQR